MCNISTALGAWGECHVLGPVAGGHRNIAFKVKRGGRYFVAKTTRRSHEALVWLDNVFDLAERAGLLVPRLIATANGDICHNGWTLEPFLAGRHALHAERVALQPAIDKFHNISQSIAQRPGFASSKHLVTQFISGDTDLHRMPAPIVAKCRAAWRDLPNAPMSVVHADICCANLLIAPNQPPALIDWDESRVDFELFDASDDRYSRARLAWEIAACWQVEPERNQNLAAKF